MHKAYRIDIENHYEDLELVKRVLKRDSQALERLYYKYNKRLTCFINSFVTGYDDAQDILQSTFISALDSLESYKGTSQFFTWLCGVARHKISDHFRSKRWREGSLDELADGNPVINLEQAQAFSLDEWIVDREFSDKVHNVIGMMPEHYQSLLIGKYIHGRTLKELAADRAMSEKAVESLMTRARKQFRQLFQQSDYFAGGVTNE